jgi:hypothetical protein
LESASLVLGFTQFRVRERPRDVIGPISASIGTIIGGRETISRRALYPFGLIVSFYCYLMMFSFTMCE